MKTYTLNNTTVSAEELKRLIKENPELLEKGTKPWRAEKGEEYWYVEDCGLADCDTEGIYDADNFRFLTGNYFRTEEEAEAHKARLEAIGRVTHAILERNEGWTPDWSDDDQSKHHIWFDHDCSTFDVDYDCSIQESYILPYIASREIAKGIIRDFEGDLKIIFGI